MSNAPASLAWSYYISPFSSNSTLYLSVSNNIVNLQSTPIAWNLTSDPSTDLGSMVLANCSSQLLYLDASGSQAGSQAVVSPDPFSWYFWRSNPGYYIINQGGTNNNVAFSNSSGTVTLRPSSNFDDHGEVADPDLFWQFTPHPHGHKNPVNPGCPNGYVTSGNQ